jgi:hypothetical protein
VTIRHSVSRAETQVAAMRLDEERRTVHVRYGMGALHEMSLISGQGVGAIGSWRLERADLEALRAIATREGIHLPPLSDLVPSAPVRRASVRPVETDPRQASLFGGSR